MPKYISSFLLFAFSFSSLSAQQLKPGFDKGEFIELLKIGARTTKDSTYFQKLPAPERSVLLYQSDNTGFDNAWQLWRMNEEVAVISIRGTTRTAFSFLANMYAAMVSAKGTLELEKDFVFKYELSKNPRAAVHVGFLVATAYLQKDILPKIDSCYQKGIRNFIVTGHSQGGAITYLLTSYLESLKSENRLPKDIRFKTYAAAAPKPGNLYYAYDFENLTRNGWAFNVVNSVDWVPEVPFSIQTLNDMNETNPFTNARKLIKKQKFPKDIVLLTAYNQLSKPAKKAQKNYEKWLGERLGKYVKKGLKEYSAPEYFNSNNYVRTGTTIVLVPDSSYFIQFPEIRDSIWHNHTQIPYLFLAERMPDNDQANTQLVADSKLNGSWQLDHIAGQSIPFNDLYPDKKPRLVFNTLTNEMSGHSGCNSFSGKLNVTLHTINFKAPFAITRMSCPGNAESIFLESLKLINRYSVSDNQLTLLNDDVAEMHFRKM